MHLLQRQFFKVSAIVHSFNILCMKRFFLLCFFLVCLYYCNAQGLNCNFDKPVIAIDFGDDANPKDFSLSQLKKRYRRVRGVCPDDGQFTFSSFTNNCFNGNWLAFNKDHTPGSVKGRMMVVNAAYEPATFFSVTLTGLKPSTGYELSTWLVNVCPGRMGCEPTPPRLRILVVADGKLLTTIYTGPIAATGTASWKRFAGTFTTPAVFSGIVVVMDDLTTGGCGNDFAMDDIEVRECRIIKNDPPPAPRPVTVVTKQAEKPAPPNLTEQKQAPVPVIRKKETAELKKQPADKVSTAVQPSVKPLSDPLPVPDIIKKRDNPVAQKIITPASAIKVELYDNGDIDGDTVTIYHNNNMVVSRAGLSVKPVTLTIQVDENQPHHELVMVANNLGSIPPNTSLMVVTTMYKRYEVFISSSEQKNAMVVVDLEKR